MKLHTNQEANLTSTQKKKAARIARIMESFDNKVPHYKTWKKSIEDKFRHVEMLREGTKKDDKKGGKK